MTKHEASLLKPCPFCGGKAILKKPGRRSLSYWAKCAGEKCQVHPQTDYKYTPEEAIEAWNRRAHEY